MTLTEINQHIAMLQSIIDKAKQGQAGNEDICYKYWHGHTLGTAEGQLQVYEYLRNQIKNGTLIPKNNERL